MADWSLFLAGLGFTFFGGLVGYATTKAVGTINEGTLAFMLVPLGLCMMFAGYTGVGL